MDWSFLDEMDKNLLYLYARGLTRQQKGIHFMNLYTPDEAVESEEHYELLKLEIKRKTALYIIWFVFRYVLQCETLEEAEKHATPETLKKFKISCLFKNRHIYIGICNTDYEIRFHCGDEAELKTVLEILYGRYNFFEQLECYIRRTEGTSKRTRNKCITILESVQKIINDNPRYQKMVDKYLKK